MITTPDATIYQGTVENILTTVVDAAGTVKSVAGATAVLLIGDIRGGYTYLSKACSLVTDGTDGKFTVELTAVETAALPAKKCDYQIKVTDADGDIQIVKQGFITILATLQPT